MEIMHLNIAETNLSLRITLFCILGVPMNTLAPIRNCLVVASYAKLDAGVKLLNANST